MFSPIFMSTENYIQREQFMTIHGGSIFSKIGLQPFHYDVVTMVS